MIVDEEVYFDHKIEDFLEHHGVKGQKWGYRHPRLRSASKTAGKIAWKGTKAIGRGTWTTVKFLGREAKAHPKTAMSIVAGAALAAAVLSRRGNVAVKEADHFKQLSSSGSAWRTANGPWNYAPPRLKESTQVLIRNGQYTQAHREILRAAGGVRLAS